MIPPISVSFLYYYLLSPSLYMFHHVVMVGCRCVAAGLVSIFPTSRLFCDLHFYYDDDDDERDNSLFHPLDEVNVEHLQTTTTRQEKWRVVCCILGAKKSEYLLFQLCLEGRVTQTHNWFFSLYIARWLCRRRRRRVFGGEWVPNLELYGAETDMEARVDPPPPIMLFSLSFVCIDTAGAYHIVRRK